MIKEHLSKLSIFFLHLACLIFATCFYKCWEAFAILRFISLAGASFNGPYWATSEIFEFKIEIQLSAGLILSTKITFILRNESQ